MFGSVPLLLGGAEPFFVWAIILLELLCNINFHFLLYNLMAPEEAKILYTMGLFVGMEVR
jgi:hypothetical protein